MSNLETFLAIMLILEKKGLRRKRQNWPKMAQHMLKWLVLSLDGHSVITISKHTHKSRWIEEPFQLPPSSAFMKVKLTKMAQHLLKRPI